MDATVTILGPYETGTTHLENCLTCGKKTEMPVLRFDYVIGKERRGSSESCPPHCPGCASRHRRGLLPVHPFWVRASADPVRVRRS